MRALRTMLTMLLIALVLAADPDCPCFPNETTWIATYCETWNCAASALITANGDPHVLAVPTGNDSP